MQNAKNLLVRSGLLLTSAFILYPSSFPDVPPTSERGNVNEIMSRFGGALLYERLRRLPAPK